MISDVNSWKECDNEKPTYTYMYMYLWGLYNTVHEMEMIMYNDVIRNERKWEDTLGIIQGFDLAQWYV